MTGERADPAGDPRVGVIGGSRLLRVSLALLLEANGWRTQEWPWPSPEQHAAILQAGVSVAVVDLVGASRQDRTIVTTLSSAGVPVLVITPSDAAPMLGRCIELGASAAVSVGDPFDRVVESLRQIGQSRPQWAPAERERLLGAWQAVRAERDHQLAHFQNLSRREVEILVLIIQGHSAEAIARELFVSQATVRSHIKSLLRKLDVNSQLEAVALAARVGWHPGPEAELP